MTKMKQYKVVNRTQVSTILANDLNEIKEEKEFNSSELAEHILTKLNNEKR